jgi:hypothetical protein
MINLLGVESVPDRTFAGQDQGHDPFSDLIQSRCGLGTERSGVCMGCGYNSFSLMPGFFDTLPKYSFRFCLSFFISLSNDFFSRFAGSFYLSLSLAMGFLNPAS